MLASRGVDRNRGAASQRRLLHWSNHEPLPMDCCTRTDWNRLSGFRPVLLPVGSELQLLHNRNSGRRTRKNERTRQLKRNTNDSVNATKNMRKSSADPHLNGPSRHASRQKTMPR